LDRALQVRATGASGTFVRACQSLVEGSKLRLSLDEHLATLRSGVTYLTPPRY
jgi:hypothetical protein